MLKGDQFTYQGFQFDAINATTLGLTSLHIDIWSADATPVKAYVISAGQDTESVDIVPTAGAWKGVDIPLSSFTKINKGAIFQLKLDTAIQPVTKVMYFDNIYFSKPSSGGSVASAPTTQCRQHGSYSRRLWAPCRPTPVGGASPSRPRPCATRCCPTAPVL